MTKYKLIWFIIYEPESDQNSATYWKMFFIVLSTSNHSINNPNNMFVFCIFEDVL